MNGDHQRGLSQLDEVVFQRLANNAGDDARRIADHEVRSLLCNVNQRGNGNNVRENNTVRLDRSNEPKLIGDNEQITVLERRHHFQPDTSNRPNGCGGNVAVHIGNGAPMFYRVAQQHAGKRCLARAGIADHHHHAIESADSFAQRCV